MLEARGSKDILHVTWRFQKGNLFPLNLVHFLQLSCILHLFPFPIISLSASVNFVGHPGPHVPKDARVWQTVLYLELKMHSLKVWLPTVKGKLHALLGSGPPTVMHLRGHPKIYLCRWNRFPHRLALIRMSKVTIAHHGFVIPKNICLKKPVAPSKENIRRTSLKYAHNCLHNSQRTGNPKPDFCSSISCLQKRCILTISLWTSGSAISPV
jgi:hypothetical protein